MTMQSSDSQWNELEHYIIEYNDDTTIYMMEHKLGLIHRSLKDVAAMWLESPMSGLPCGLVIAVICDELCVLFHPSQGLLILRLFDSFHNEATEGVLCQRLHCTTCAWFMRPCCECHHKVGAMCKGQWAPAIIGVSKPMLLYYRKMWCNNT